MDPPSLPPGRAWADATAATSGMTPRRSSRGLDGLAVSAWYSDGDRRVRRRGRLLIAEGVVSFSPFETTDRIVEVSCPAVSITMRRGPAPWSGWQLELDGQASATVIVPRRSQRRIRAALAAAGVQRQG